MTRTLRTPWTSTRHGMRTRHRRAVVHRHQNRIQIRTMSLATRKHDLRFVAAHMAIRHYRRRCLLSSALGSVRSSNVCTSYKGASPLRPCENLEKDKPVGVRLVQNPSSIDRRVSLSGLSRCQHHTSTQASCVSHFGSSKFGSIPIYCCCAYDLLPNHARCHDYTVT